MVRFGYAFVVAALLLTGCGGESPGDRPQGYQIDQDINASRGTSIPTASSPGSRGIESWRADPYGYSQNTGH